MLSSLQERGLLAKKMTSRWLTMTRQQVPLGPLELWWLMTIGRGGVPHLATKIPTLCHDSGPDQGTDRRQTRQTHVPAYLPTGRGRALSVSAASVATYVLGYSRVY